MIGVKQIQMDNLLRQDRRGWNIAPLNAAGKRALVGGNLHVASLEPGAARGNHGHADTTEWLLVFGGPGKLLWRMPDDPPGTVQQVDVNTGDKPCLFEIEPNVTHTIANTSDKEVLHIVAFFDKAEIHTESRTPLA